MYKYKGYHSLHDDLCCCCFQICHPAPCQVPSLLLASDSAGVSKHYLCSGRTLQPTAVAHRLPMCEHYVYSLSIYAKRQITVNTFGGFFLAELYLGMYYLSRSLVIRLEVCILFA